MKKRIFALLVAMLMLVSVLALTSCDVMSMLPDSITSLIPGFNGGDKTCADGHVDADSDEICDNCGASVPAQDSGENEPDGPTEELPEEPEREPTYQITFNFHGVVYENAVVTEGEDLGKIIMENGKPKRIGTEQDVTVYTLDVLQNQAPTAEQLAEIPNITYGGVPVSKWYDSPALENEVDFTEVLTGDKTVYAKLRIEEPPKKDDGYCGEDATWKLTTTGVLKINGKVAMYDFTYPELAPWYFNENGERNKITAIEISKNITHIGSYSFYNVSIVTPAESIEMGAGVKSIGAHAFAYSTALVSLPLTDTIEVIGYGAFEGCRKLTTLVIPDSVVTIDGNAFYGCQAVTKLVLGKGVKSIGEQAFANTAHTYTYYRGTQEEYSNITVKLGNDSFDSSGAYLYFYTDADSAEAKTAGQYWYYANNNPKHTSYTIRYYPSKGNFPIFTDFVYIDADKTGTYSDANKAAMEAIVYRGYKFASWSGLAQYLSGAKLTDNADFRGQRGNLIGDNISYSYDIATQTLILTGEGSTWDFDGIGDSLDFLTRIDEDTVKIVFDSRITRLGANSLGGLLSVLEIDLPETITSVDPKAFAGCTSLASIYYGGESLSVCEGIESLLESTAKAYAKCTEKSIGQSGAYWMFDVSGNRLAWSFKDSVLTIGGADVMPDFEKGAAPWLAFTTVKEIVFASNVKTIGANAFAGMQSVEKITLHKALKTIPRSAFEGSAYWNNEANWKNGALMAGSHLLAFDASKLPEGVTIATIPQATKVIAADAFLGCDKITALVLPMVIDGINETSFDGLTGIEVVYYYGQNVHAWNDLPNAANDLLELGAKIIYRAPTKPAENLQDYWHMVNKVPTTWDKG